MSLRDWFVAVDDVEAGEPYSDPLAVERQYTLDIAELNRIGYEYEGEEVLPSRRALALKAYKKHAANKHMNELDLYKYMYYVCRYSNNKDGLLIVEGEQILLLGTDGNAFAGQLYGQADLVGLRKNGGLVVFECKKDKKQQPLSSLLQALAYLSSFMSTKSHDQVARDAKLRMAELEGEGTFPDTFRGVSPSASIKGLAVVLAPRAYYEKYGGYSDWKEFLSRYARCAEQCSYECKMVVSDFLSYVAVGLEPELLE